VTINSAQSSHALRLALLSSNDANRRSGWPSFGLVRDRSGFHPITAKAVGQMERVSKFSAKMMRTTREHGAKLALMDRSYSATRGLKNRG